MIRVGRDFERQLPDSAEQLRSSDSFWRVIHIDPLLMLGLLALTCYGLVVLYSASGQADFIIKRQIIFFSIAYFGMIFVAQLNLQFIQRWSIWMYLAGTLLLVCVLFFGVGAKGAQRWISLGFF